MQTLVEIGPSNASQGQHSRQPKLPNFLYSSNCLFGGGVAEAGNAPTFCFSVPAISISSASTWLEDTSKKETKRTAKSAPINPCPSREGPYLTVFSVSRPMDPLMWLAGLLAYREMSRRIPDRQPRLGLATCVRQK